MSDTKNLYMPIFYNTLELTAELSDEEFGIVIRALLTKLGNDLPREESMPVKLKIAYNYMLDAAKRIIERENSGSQKSFAKKDKAEKEPFPVKRYGNFDPREAFEKALERSYGKKEPTQTSCTDS